MALQKQVIDARQHFNAAVRALRGEKVRVAKRLHHIREKMLTLKLMMPRQLQGRLPPAQRLLRQELPELSRTPNFRQLLDFKCNTLPIHEPDLDLWKRLRRIAIEVKTAEGMTTTAANKPTVAVAAAAPKAYDAAADVERLALDKPRHFAHAHIELASHRDLFDEVLTLDKLSDVVDDFTPIRRSGSSPSAVGSAAVSSVTAPMRASANRPSPAPDNLQSLLSDKSRLLALVTSKTPNPAKKDVSRLIGKYMHDIGSPLALMREISPHARFFVLNNRIVRDRARLQQARQSEAHCIRRLLRLRTSPARSEYVLPRRMHHALISNPFTGKMR